MKELHIAKEILHAILVDDERFAIALKNKFLADPTIREYRKNVAALVGAELRHHLLLSHLTKGMPLSEDEKLYAFVAITDLFYCHRLGEEEVKAELKSLLSAESYEALEPILAKAGKPEEYLPSDVEGAQRLSLQFNTPEWVLRVLNHYGERVMVKVLRANTRKAPTTVRIANKNLTEDALLLDKSFKKTNVDGIYLYEGTEPLRKHPLFANKSIFVERPAIKATLDKFVISEPSQALLFNGAKNDVAMRELLATYGKSVNLHIGVYNVEDYVDFAKLVAHDHFPNIKFFSADPLAMAAAVSGPQDLVICYPESTNFDLIREEPDYLLHFKKESMDDLFRKEKEALEGCAKYVADQGTLIYMISTISRKEGHSTVAEFLKANEDFTLVNELQLYPFDDLGTSMYYAVLHKSEKEIKIAPPLGDLTDAVSESSGVSCSEK